MDTRKKYSGQTALYFEDQPEQVRAIVDFLTNKLGFQVTPAESPEQVFDCLAKQKFDLVILDVRIINGEQTREGAVQNWRRYGLYFLEELREGRILGPTPNTVPVLVVTCVVNTADVERIASVGKKAGGRCWYLEKPIENLALVETAIDELLAR
ncbi:MAG: response regulator [Bryobacteraceae bacterium]